MQKNHHNQIRLSQRNPCKIKVFLGCPYYTAISTHKVLYVDADKTLLSLSFHFHVIL